MDVYGAYYCRIGWVIIRATSFWINPTFQPGIMETKTQKMMFLRNLNRDAGGLKGLPVDQSPLGVPGMLLHMC
jgi:hypothetical protein